MHTIQSVGNFAHLPKSRNRHWKIIQPFKNLNRHAILHMPTFFQLMELSKRVLNQHLCSMVDFSLHSTVTTLYCSNDAGSLLRNDRPGSYQPGTKPWLSKSKHRIPRNMLRFFLLSDWYKRKILVLVVFSFIPV